MKTSDSSVSVGGTVAVDRVVVLEITFHFLFSRCKVSVKYGMSFTAHGIIHLLMYRVCTL